MQSVSLPCVPLSESLAAATIRIAPKASELPTTINLAIKSRRCFENTALATGRAELLNILTEVEFLVAANG